MPFIHNFFERGMLSPARAVGRFVRSILRQLADLLHRHHTGLAITSLIFLFVFVYFIWRIVILVDAGEAAVKFSRFGGGTQTERVYGEGIHLIFPWDHMEVYNVRVMETDHTADLLSLNGLKISFRLSIRHRPEYDLLAILHQEVGPDYVQKVVIPEVVSVLRTEVGALTAEEIFTTKRGILDLVFKRAIENVAHRYVLIDQVIIRSIELPRTVASAIESKLVEKEIAASYEYLLEAAEKEALRREIEAEGLRTYNEILASSLTEEVIRWKGIEATRQLATSENSKIIVIGNGDDGMPVILGAGDSK